MRLVHKSSLHDTWYMTCTVYTSYKYKNVAFAYFQNDSNCRTSSPQQIVEKVLKSNRMELNSSQQEILKRYLPILPIFYHHTLPLSVIKTHNKVLQFNSWYHVYDVFRLKKLQESMVGGERVNDRELQERRLRKKKAAERRLNALARALATVETEDGPNLVLDVYDDIQEELRAKNEALKKYRQKVYYIICYYGIHTLRYIIVMVWPVRLRG